MTSQFNAKNNRTGGNLESTVQDILSRKGFEVVLYKDYKINPSKFGKEILIKNYPFRTIYDHDGKTEFLLISEKFNLKMRIECKWQQTSGSVDEKLPYLYLNCIEAMPETQILILIDGGGFKPGSIKWLKEAVKKKKYQTSNKNIIVFNLIEFITWTNNDFKI